MCQSLFELNSQDEAIKYCRKALKARDYILMIDPSNAEVHSFFNESYDFIIAALKKNDDLSDKLKLYNNYKKNKQEIAAYDTILE